MTSTVSEKGQITIPKAVRDRLGIAPGTKLDVRDEDGVLVARKVTERDPVDAAWGVLAGRGRTDALLAQLRDEQR